MYQNIKISNGGGWNSKNIIKLSFTAIFAISLQASETDVNLDTIMVTDSAEDIKEKKVGETKKTAKELSKQQVSDTRDMVKYETGVSVVESGRFGASGYSIRGVDENRVAIQIDGLNQAQTLSSQGFKEIFEGYGNFNNTRNSIEIENVKQVNITKGADSIKTGSGALGGSVMFETKDARDYLLDKDWHYGFKVGHNSANDERMHSHTLAARFKWFDILVIKTDRDGRELKNFDYSKFDDSVRGREREKADPYNIIKEGTLIKFGFSPHDEHRFSFANDKYMAKNQGSDYSYTLYPPSINKDNVKEKRGERYTDDLSERLNQSFTYENFTQTPFWDNFKITYSHQKIKQRARTEEYCRDGEKCINIANPLGLKLDGSKTVDKNGNEIKIGTEYYLTDDLATQYSSVDDYNTNYPGWKSLPKRDYIKDANGNKILLSDTFSPIDNSTKKDTRNFKLDCSIFDCTKSINVMKKTEPNLYTKIYEADWDIKSVDLSKSENDEYQEGSSKYRFKVDTEQVGDKTYKSIKRQRYNSFSNAWVDDPRPSSNTGHYKYIMPNSRGFLTNDWKERDLDTDTKQLNLDFEKELEILSTEHSLKYGVIYSKTTKSMINRGGYYAENPQWWANTYPIDCQKASYDEELRCPRVSPETSFLIPVETKNNAFYLSENIQINDYIGVDLAYRYDKVKHNPTYIPGKTPAIPDDMVKGIFIPIPQAKQEIVFNKPEPKYWDYIGGHNNQQYKIDLENYNKEKAQIDAQNAEIKAYNANLEPQNVIDNINYFAKPKEFKSDSYAFGLNLDPFSFLRLQAKYSKAFRAPTTDEMYLTFKHPDITIRPNPDLKSEIAKTKEFAITLHNNSSFATFSAFKTDYTDFLDFKFMGRKRLNTSAGVNSALDFDIWQNINRANAEVSGFEINSRLNLGDVSNLFGGLYVGYKLTKQKGKISTDNDGKVPMNAIQPQTSVYNLGYATKNEKYGFDIFITNVKAKEAKDTYNMFWQHEQGDTINGRVVSDYRSHWLSDKYRTFDFIAFAKPVKNLTLQFGVYNITNQKYITWENARSIRSFGTTNMVRKSDSLGINRFYSPGRNFKLTFEMTF